MNQTQSSNRSHDLIRELASRPTHIVLFLAFLLEMMSGAQTRFFGLRGEATSLATYLAFAPTLPSRHFYLPWIFSAFVHLGWWHFISNAPWFWFVGRQLERTVNPRLWFASLIAGVLLINLILAISTHWIVAGSHDFTLGLSAITLCIGLQALILEPRLSLIAFFVLFGIVLASDPSLFGSPLGAVGHGAGLVTGLVWGISARVARRKSRADERSLHRR